QLSVSELADYSGLNINAVYRITALLRDEGFLSQQNKRGKYSPGPKFLEFGNLARDMLNIEDLSRPYMTKLNNLINENVHIAILDDQKAVIIALIDGTQALRIVTELKADLPLYGTGVGQVLLAHMTEVELNRYFAKIPKLQAYTSNTITDQEELIKHLLTIRQQGIACERAEYASGIVNIAAPIKNEIGRVIAVLGILIPEPRATDKQIAKLITLAKNTAMEISSALGYNSH
ncbi:IclR family transcriptional regulator, partial [Chloroflexota bacterium]